MDTEKTYKKFFKKIEKYLAIEKPHKEKNHRLNIPQNCSESAHKPTNDIIDENNIFCRSYSLTKAEIGRMNKWKEQHYKKYHKKADDKKFKKNPFYGGVSPVSRFIVEFSSCSIGTGADCICTECRKEYEKLRDKIGTARKGLEELSEKYRFEIRGYDDWEY